MDIHVTQPNGKTLVIRPRDIYLVRNAGQDHTPFTELTIRGGTVSRSFRVREGIEQIKGRTPSEDWVYTTGEDGMSMYVNFSALIGYSRGFGRDGKLVELRFASACARYVHSSRELDERLREADSPSVA